jgi:hypothetical protein
MEESRNPVQSAVAAVVEIGEDEEVVDSVEVDMKDEHEH